MKRLYYCYVIHAGEQVYDRAAQTAAERDSALDSMLAHVHNPDMILVGTVRADDVNSALVRVRQGDWDFTKR